MNTFIEFLKRKTIRVYALVGESGTGKSFKSKIVAQKYGIHVIIDDGLLINDDKIFAGHSAKREKTYMGAVRVALFDDKEHRDEIARALYSMRIRKILLLGTSDKMVMKIAARLQLPPPSKIIRIEDISSREDIENAIRARQVEGKHVIPVPAIEVERKYPKIFYNSVKVLLKKKKLFGKAKSGEDTAKLFEKSIVRPEFFKQGRISMSEAAITQMTTRYTSEFNQNIHVKKLSIKTEKYGYRLIVTIDVPFGTQLTNEIYSLQQYIIENIERATGILIEEVNIIIDKIIGIEGIKHLR